MSPKYSSTTNQHLWVCQNPVSMRYGIRGLTQMIWSWKGHSPVSGDVYVFFSRDRKTMKALKWDGDVFLMYTKRLSQERFLEVLKNGDSSARRLQWDNTKIDAQKSGRLSFYVVNAIADGCTS